ncbi:MAG: hypothetical protein P4N60_09845 [Verrucomicrobiae bacterium]|nr:hypothetical protein [Verrucomicrobiae bacterium]
MKLRSLAALIFRFIGLFYIIDGLTFDLVSAIAKHDGWQIVNVVLELGLGGLLYQVQQKDRGLVLPGLGGLRRRDEAVSGGRFVFI